MRDPIGARLPGLDRRLGSPGLVLWASLAMLGCTSLPRAVATDRHTPAATVGVTVYALLDSPSATGAYRFAIFPGATTVMDVDAAIYPRKPIERLGVAPLTSMFQYGENDRRMANDWRPEIHDSDGLAMWTGRGEWIWRPLVNPPQLRFNSHGDENPRGFGLLGAHEAAPEIAVDLRELVAVDRQVVGIARPRRALARQQRQQQQPDRQRGQPDQPDRNRDAHVSSPRSAFSRRRSSGLSAAASEAPARARAR